MDDFRADALVRENFQQQRVRRAPVDEVHAPDAALERLHGGIDFRNHAGGNHAGFFQFRHFVNAQRRNERVGIFRVGEQPGNVGHEDEASRLERARDGAGGGVGVRVVGPIFVVEGNRRNDGNFSLVERLFDDFRFYGFDVSHEAEVDGISVFVAGFELFADVDEVAGHAYGNASALFDESADVGVDFVVERVFDDLDRLLVRHADAVAPLRLDGGLFHRARDRFPAAVDDDDLDADRAEENDVGRDSFPRGGIFGIHEAAAVFDDEDGVVEALDVRERFQQDAGFGNEFRFVDGFFFNHRREKFR